MQFNALHKLHFSAGDGAYSIVTDREIVDSQITLTDHEANIVIRTFGKENIQRGNVGANRQKALKKFNLVTGGENSSISLNLVFPKPEKDELRLYLRKEAFKPNPGEIWFLYPSNGAIHLGSMTETQWRSIGRNDDDDITYQNLVINGNELLSPSYREIASRIIQKRNPELAKQRIQHANYTCEISAQCRLFKSRSSGFNYLEAHHFIPLAFQPLFKNTLDTLDNIVALCPFCHRAIHHAEVDHTRSLIDSLVNHRQSLLTNYNVTESDLYDYYNCEIFTS